MGKMPQKRNPENRGFPPRWRAIHGAIYYRVPKGLEWAWDGKKLFRLGTNASEAYKVWANRINKPLSAKIIGDILDRYLLEVVPLKQPKSQSADRHNALKLRKVFGDMYLDSIEPQHIYQYVDKSPAKVAAKRQIALLSHMFTKSVEWGYLNKHPFKGEVRLPGEKPRTRYVKDLEVIECLSLPAKRERGGTKVIQFYMRLKLLTGLRRSDLLRIKMSDCTEEGIFVETKKTGKQIIYAWSKELREAVEGAKSVRPVDIGPHLFCTDMGKSYYNEETGESAGWASMWRRFFARVLKETKVTEHFTEHDLRAKVASDAESLEHARQLLTHADSNITNRVYRRKAEVIKPTKSITS